MTVVVGQKVIAGIEDQRVIHILQTRRLVGFQHHGGQRPVQKGVVETHHHVGPWIVLFEDELVEHRYPVPRGVEKDFDARRLGEGGGDDGPGAPFGTEGVVAVHAEHPGLRLGFGARPLRRRPACALRSRRTACLTRGIPGAPRRKRRAREGQHNEKEKKSMIGSFHGTTP